MLYIRTVYMSHLCLQDIDISGDPADTHSLFVVVHSRNSTQKRPKLSGRFVFEDHIRCCAAKSVFQRARDHLHHAKMTRIAKMLHLPLPDSPSAVPVASQQQLPDATPPTLTTPTMLNTPSPRISSSVLHEVFRGPSPVSTSMQSQEIELSSLTTPEQARRSLRLGDEIPAIDTPVRLTLPAPLFNAVVEGWHRDGRVSRDISSTPEPPSYSSTDGVYEMGDPEEALTANGGLFRFHDSSNLMDFEESMDAGMLSISGEGGSSSLDKEGEEGVCPLGLAMEGAILDRLDATGESVIAVQQEPSQPCESVRQPTVNSSLTGSAPRDTPLTEQEDMADTPSIEHAQEDVADLPFAWEGTTTDRQHGDDILDTESSEHSWMDGDFTAEAQVIRSATPHDTIVRSATPHDLNTDKGNEITQGSECEQDIVTNPTLEGVSPLPETENNMATGGNSRHTEHAQSVSTEHHLIDINMEYHSIDAISSDTEQAENHMHSAEQAMVATEHAQTVTATEHAQWRRVHSEVNLTVDTVSLTPVVMPVLEPQRTSNNQSVLSSKSATSTAADISVTLDAARVLVTAETGERTPPSSEDSQ